MGPIKCGLPATVTDHVRSPAWETHPTLGFRGGSRETGVHHEKRLSPCRKICKLGGQEREPGMSRAAAGAGSGRSEAG